MNFNRFFRRGASGSKTHNIPEGQRVYAIGDIHGRDDLLADLITLIEYDNAARSSADVTLILLGDLVNRGPSSKQVIDRVIHLSETWPDVRWIIGNHEEIFMKALHGDPAALRYFVRIGGGPTILSYGITREEFGRLTSHELAKIFPSLVPDSHVCFLKRGEESIRTGDYLFVHAGIRPGVSLDNQKSSDLRWIREDFLADKRNHGPMVIHGHTITRDVDTCHNRIGIDTGAYRSGVLTAIILEGGNRHFLQTKRGDSAVRPAFETD